MKVWNILIVVLLVACNKAQEKGFVKIELDPIDRDKIIQSIIPDKKYVYWEYGRIDMIRDSYTIRIVGDSAFKKLIIKPKSGFFVECMPGYCASYIAFIDSGKVKYVTTESEFRKFIGKIDNLEEALLVSKTYDLWFDEKDKRGGSYRRTQNGYELYLCKYCHCPVSKESIKVYIDSSGNFKSINKGYYYKSKDCIMM